MLDALEIVGIAILIGYFISKLMDKLKIPAVGGYVLIGIIFGESCLNIFTEKMLSEVTIISNIALGIIAYIIGSELQLKRLQKMGKQITIIVLFEAILTFILVSIGLYFLTRNISLSLILGSIAAATAPAATVMVIKELKARGPFTETLLALVAIDDGISLLIFGFASAIARTLLDPSQAISVVGILKISFSEIFGAIILGIIFGLFSSFILKKTMLKENCYIIVIGIIFIICGIADQLHISSLMANMVYGIVIANLVPIAGKKAFNSIHELTPPIFIAFFVTAGAHLRIDLFISLWCISSIYLITRVAGKFLGASTGAIIAKSSDSIKKYIGFGLISQVGVAIGLAMVVTSEFSHINAAGKELSMTVVNVLLGTTIITEILGPILTKYSLKKAGEVNIKKRG